jgi:hypothetical protein
MNIQEYNGLTILTVETQITHWTRKEVEDDRYKEVEPSLYTKWFTYHEGHSSAGYIQILLLIVYPKTIIENGVTISAYADFYIRKEPILEKKFGERISVDFLVEKIRDYIENNNLRMFSGDTISIPPISI